MSNQYTKQLDNILKQEIDRAQFIKYIGVALIGAMGISSFIKSLHKSLSPKPKTTLNWTAGYGKSAYGR